MSKANLPAYISDKLVPPPCFSISRLFPPVLVSSLSCTHHIVYSKGPSNAAEPAL